DAIPAATAASTAFPPSARTRAPTSAVTGWPAAIAPRILPVSMRTLKARLTLAGLSTLVVVAAAATPRLLGSQVGRAFERLDDAQPAWIWAAGLLVVATLAAWAQAWRSVIRSCGGDVGRADAIGCYAIGSAVNTLAPARLGDVVRIALFA